MNVEEVHRGMSEGVRRMSDEATQALRSGEANDPRHMLEVQFKLQQFSTMVGLHSASIKLIKDTVMGIIGKIA
ncbi:type III secretion system needle filament subunit SctF [Pandoraea nosoerga]|uniref:EscF/YscF/HrpA family type III secretion system needle major subunit n=1 Tax=Pandoraea nosoerga TaxID=2508296 RepID=A0A5E4XFY7_9BURK|nr:MULTISPECIES: type III secretion system needle filament subunit SctF [Pandoraea]MBN4668261.1 type III secretion system needle filament subunit SctF [Pandoraea nosoerga]MBN4677752.1 type III secretion system needle filament subunit SctF [Pandoraea nosoerga]MBN4682720.1 type III secretion system needle filament subunit SctF [Pandoraea nosoerga]MBN4746584.1 type III secretion system needle filament subunit SctF [Pandoraea nosoerga]VVE35294.1 EscF/YscF/HrpA family type III secretion system need